MQTQRSLAAEDWRNIPSIGGNQLNSAKHAVSVIQQSASSPSLGDSLAAGPGTISATVLLSSQLSAGSAGNGRAAMLALICIIAFLMALTAGLLVAAELLDKYIGNTGKLVLTRLLGVLLAALSVQYIADGVLAFA